MDFIDFGCEDTNMVHVIGLNVDFVDAGLDTTVIFQCIRKEKDRTQNTPR